MAKKKVRRKAASKLPEDAITSKIAFVGLLKAKDRLFYTVKGTYDLEAEKGFNISFEKADLLELGLDRAETHLANMNTNSLSIM